MDKIRYCTIVSFAIIIFASMMPNSLALNTESWDGQLASRALTVETDWVIDSWMKIANEDYVLKGNLTITATGNLTLVNSTLTFQPSGNYTYGIFIEAGGQLHTTDLDDDPDTADDYSVIKTKSNPSSY